MEPTVDSNRDRRFTEELERHHRRLYGYIFTLLRNSADADDVFQQTSLVLWRKFEEFHADTCFLTWACTVARFTALDFIKQQRRYRNRFSDIFESRLAAVHENIASEVFEARLAALEDCIKKLPPEQQVLIRKCFSGKYTVSEVAESLGRTSHSVYSSLRNIREKLLDCIETTISEESEP